MKAAITMAPTNPQLPYSLGTMLTKMGQEAEAAVYYNKAVELKPDYQEAKNAIQVSE
jgi:Flp pilus assembly protein TadD